jgi:hypothetical protein
LAQAAGGGNRGLLLVLAPKAVRARPVACIPTEGSRCPSARFGV